MTFLTPLPAIIAAAVTLPTLLVLYFLKLRRRPVRVSSTMLWTARTRDLQVNVPFRWLRPSLLLLLQLAILALFLLALARPAINMDGSAPARVIVLIDRSASMSARDGDGGAGEPGGAGPTRLERARGDATEFVNGLLRGSGSTEVCVIGFAHEPRVAAAFTNSVGRAREAIASLTLTDQPADLAAALKLAGTLLSSSSAEGEEAPAPAAGLCVLFSDGGFAPGEPLVLTGGAFRYQRIGTPHATPEAAGGASARDNIGIVGIAARRDHADPALIRVFVRVLSTLAAPTLVPLTLTLDGQTVERRALEVAGAGADGAPGQSSFTLQARTTGAGVLVVSIGRTDVLAADDAAAVVLAAAARPRIVLVVPGDGGGGGGEPSGEGPEWLIADVLRELNPRSLRVLPAGTYEAAVGSESGLAADLIVFDRVTPRREPPAPSLSFGAGIPGVGLGAAGAGTPVLTWDRSHPALRNASLDAVVVAQPRPVVAESPEQSIGELARGRAGPLIVQAGQGATRRIVVAFELAQSNWPLDPGFPIFVADAVDYLTIRGEDAAGEGGATFTTAQPAEFLVRGTAERITIRGPVEIVASAPADGPGPHRVSVGVLERAGVYRWDEGGTTGGGAIAANLVDATESAIGVADALRVSGETVTGDAAEEGAPREVWTWFVLAALVLLAVEWFLHAWLMRV